MGYPDILDIFLILVHPRTNFLGCRKRNQSGAVGRSGALATIEHRDPRRRRPGPASAEPPGGTVARTCDHRAWGWFRTPVPGQPPPRSWLSRWVARARLHREGRPPVLTGVCRGHPLMLLSYPSLPSRPLRGPGAWGPQEPGGSAGPAEPPGCAR